MGMETREPKTLEDLPQFLVTAVRPGPTLESGYICFEVDGRFDFAIESTGPLWFWLLFGKRGGLCASVQSLNKETKMAILTFEAKEEPDIVGLKLSYLSSRWQGFHVWMVLDPDWGWKKIRFL